MPAKISVSQGRNCSSFMAVWEWNNNCEVGRVSGQDCSCPLQFKTTSKLSDPMLRRKTRTAALTNTGSNEASTRRQGCVERSAISWR